MHSALRHNVKRRHKYARDKVLDYFRMRQLWQITSIRYNWHCWALSFNAIPMVVQRTGQSWKNRFRIGSLWARANEIDPALLPTMIVQIIEAEKRLRVDPKRIIEALSGNPT